MYTSVLSRAFIFLVFFKFLSYFLQRLGAGAQCGQKEIRSEPSRRCSATTSFCAGSGLVNVALDAKGSNSTYLSPLQHLSRQWQAACKGTASGCCCHQWGDLACGCGLLVIS